MYKCILGELISRVEKKINTIYYSDIKIYFPLSYWGLGHVAY